MPIRIEVDRLTHRVRRRKRWSFLLGNAAIAAIVLGLVCWAAHYAMTVLSYAQVDREIELRRDPIDPDRLVLHYRPTSGGVLGFRLVDGDRETELLDRVTSNSLGKRQTFRWRIADLQAGQPVWFTYLDGWSLTRRELRVPKLKRVTTVEVRVAGTGSTVRTDGAKVNDIDTFRGVRSESLGLYGKRTMPKRTEWITNYGGSTISEQAVNDGLDWLARHQAPDGFWSRECLGEGEVSQCEQAGVCTGEGDTYEMAHTGLALLAFQAGGHYYFNDTKYSPLVRQGLDWMVEHQREDGGLIGSKPKRLRPRFHKHYMYEHGIAAFALADACAAAVALGRPLDDTYRRAAEKAVTFIEENQHDDGGWRYTNDPTRPGDTSVTAWQLMALKSAQEAGVPIKDYCLIAMRRFFQQRATGQHGRTGYDNRQPQTDATTGVGMVARQFLFGRPNARLVREAAAYLADLAEKTWQDGATDEAAPDYYLWYYCTLGMFQAGGQNWDRWNNVVRNTIAGLQRHEGCQRGSWDPDSQWGKMGGGRIYTTALAILTLEVYYRYTPHREIRHETFELPESDDPQFNEVETKRPPPTETAP